jgi:hypothetical protein
MNSCTHLGAALHPEKQLYSPGRSGEALHPEEQYCSSGSNIKFLRNSNTHMEEG